MARLTDIIEQFIKEMLQSSKEKELQIQRNELANYFSCAPSQINYVLTTRFTTEEGYYVESKRGGGGCIIIRYVEFDQNKPLFDAVKDRIGDSITFHNGSRIVDGLLKADVITEKEASLIKVVINDRTLSSVGENKNQLRAEILKNMIFVLLL